MVHQETSLYELITHSSCSCFLAVWQHRLHQDRRMLSWEGA
jgi:hypothetical protein